MNELIHEFRYHSTCEKSIKELFDTLEYKRRIHLTNIHKDMKDFLSYYNTSFTDEEKDALLYASFYHDLGYHKDLEYTGNHALDFVLYLEKFTDINELTKKIILFHTMTDENLSSATVKNIKNNLTQREHFLIAILSYFDLHTNLRGESVSLESRLYSIEDRKKLSPDFINYAQDERDMLLDFMFNQGKKALVFDIDNTISFKNILSNYNIDMIRKAHNLGFEIILNTGKLPQALLYVDQVLGITTHKICLNGNLISIDKTHLKVLNHIDHYAEELMSSLDNNNIEYVSYREDGIIPNPNVNESKLQKIKDVGDYFESSLNSPIIKIICFINQDEREKMNQVRKIIKGKKIDVVRTSEYFFELVPHQKNKGTGLLEMFKQINLFHRASLAFGDNYNDLPMFKYSGKGYIVKNSTPYLKRRGYEVLDSDPKDAVGIKIEEVLRK